MGQQQHLNIFDHDAFLVSTAGEIEILISKYPVGSDTSSVRYFDFEGEAGQGFSVTSSEGISLIEVNNRTLKIPKALPKNGTLTLGRGDWHQLKFLTTINNTTIQLDVVA